MSLAVWFPDLSWHLLLLIRSTLDPAVIDIIHFT
jgi:hypothetical protein